MWGDDLGSRCERYLAEHVFKCPLFVYNYPRDLKSFYMKGNAPDKYGRHTVQGCDLLMPYMGELIGSSVREENFTTLYNEISRRGMSIGENLNWYLDLRKNGGCITSGSGMGFDRLIQVLCYTDSNIRDVVPFPVAYKECF
jgi:asparaginyl-tRNA synthetase